MTSQTTFQSLGLSEPLLRALAEKNYLIPSPIQSRAIPFLLEGRDLWGCAQTGTGKTAAFALPILQRLTAAKTPAHSRRPRALILTPTRELAAQIAESFATYGTHLSITSTVVFGGVGLNPQVRALARGVDVLVATPGRLLDLMSQRAVELDEVGVFVLDEADRMLDMGFAPDVRRIMARLPKRRQSLLFSATMPPAIRELAESLLQNPERIEVTPAATTVERISQRICHVAHSRKHDLLVHLLGETPGGLALVFTRTKHGANKVTRKLETGGHRTAVIHGNKSQGARQKALEEFKSGRIRVLVATDIAARGIDVKGLALVVNYDVPVEPEAYVHRIGRTARAGAEGLALTLCSPEEKALLRGIEKLIRKEIPIHPHPFEGFFDAPSQSPRAGASQRPGQRRSSSRAGSSGRSRSHSRGTRRT